jgi:hypothetical protein
MTFTFTHHDCCFVERSLNNVYVITNTPHSKKNKFMLTEILVNFGKKYKFAKGHLLDASFLFLRVQNRMNGDNK